MPIKQTDHGLIVGFGAGDVLVSWGATDEDERPCELIFEQRTPRPIGSVSEPSEIGKQADDDCVRLRFTRVESLDVVAEELAVLRRKMVGEEPRPPRKAPDPLCRTCAGRGYYVVPGALFAEATLPCGCTKGDEG